MDPVKTQNQGYCEMQTHTYKEVSARYGLKTNQQGIRFGKLEGRTILMLNVSENKQVNRYVDQWVNDGSQEFMYDGSTSKRTNENVSKYWNNYHGNYAPVVLAVGMRKYGIKGRKFAPGGRLEWVVFEGLYIRDIRSIGGKVKFIIKIGCARVQKDLMYITQRWGSELRVPLPQLATSPIQVNDDTDDEYDFINRFNRLSAYNKERFHKVIELPLVQDLLRLHVPGYIDL